MSPLEDAKIETLIKMSTKELSRLEVMQRLSGKRMSQKKAGEILHLSTRQIKRAIRPFDADVTGQLPKRNAKFRGKIYSPADKE